MITSGRTTAHAGVVAAALCALTLLVGSGCSARSAHTAGVAQTFAGPASADPTSAGPTDTDPTSDSPAPTGAASSGGAPTGGAPTSGAASGSPCPLPSPQLLVEGKTATTQSGQVMLSYLDAQRICSGDENARFVATGTAVKTAPVEPSAAVLLLAPDGGSDQLQVPPPALPAALASNKEATFYAITFDSTGAITRIEQSYRP